MMGNAGLDDPEYMTCVILSVPQPSPEDKQGEKCQILSITFPCSLPEYRALQANLSWNVVCVESMYMFSYVGCPVK